VYYGQQQGQGQGQQGQLQMNSIYGLVSQNYYYSNEQQQNNLYYGNCHGNSSGHFNNIDSGQINGMYKNQSMHIQTNLHYFNNYSISNSIDFIGVNRGSEITNNRLNIKAAEYVRNRKYSDTSSSSINTNKSTKLNIKDSENYKIKTNSAVKEVLNYY
jgi:hypothetical protein